MGRLPLTINMERAIPILTDITITAAVTRIIIMAIMAVTAAGISDMTKLLNNPKNNS